MKNLFSLLAFLVASNFAFSQIEWVGNHQFSETASDIVRTSQGQYVLLHGNGSGITVFDSDGHLIFTDTIFIFTQDGASDIIEFQDSSLMLVLGGIDCDYFPSFFVKYDKNWNKLDQDFTYGNAHIAKFSDNSIAIAGGFEGNYIERLSFNGTQIWGKELHPYEISDMVVPADDTLLVATAQGLLKLTADGTVVETIPNLVFDRIELLPNGNFLTQQGDELYLYSPDFVQLANFQQPGEAISDLAFTQNEIAVLTSAPKVVRIDLGLNPLGTTPLSGHNQTFTAVAFSEDGFVVGGGEQFGQNEHKSSASFIKGFALNGGTNNTKEDVALTQVVQSGGIEVKDYFGIYEITIPNIAISIKNNGENAIDILHLNVEFPSLNALIECSEYQVFSKSFENLNLQPNESMQLFWGEQKFGTWEDLSGEQIELCFWASLPNHHLEINNDNDVSCTEVLVAAQEPRPMDFSLAFLPSSDMVRFNLNPSEADKALSLSLFNTAGQLVVQDDSFIGPDLSIAHLPDGMYLLQLAAEGRTGWAKVLKY